MRERRELTAQRYGRGAAGLSRAQPSCGWPQPHPVRGVAIVARTEVARPRCAGTAFSSRVAARSPARLKPAATRHCVRLGPAEPRLLIVHRRGDQPRFHSRNCVRLPLMDAPPYPRTPALSRPLRRPNPFRATEIHRDGAGIASGAAGVRKQTATPKVTIVPNMMRHGNSMTGIQSGRGMPVPPVIDAARP